MEKSKSIGYLQFNLTSDEQIQSWKIQSIVVSIVYFQLGPLKASTSRVLVKLLQVHYEKFWAHNSPMVQDF